MLNFIAATSNLPQHVDFSYFYEEDFSYFRLKTNSSW